MNKMPWPEAVNDAKTGGWIVAPNTLVAIKRSIEAHEELIDVPDMEQIEAVLLAVWRMGLVHNVVSKGRATPEMAKLRYPEMLAEVASWRVPLDCSVRRMVYREHCFFVAGMMISVRKQTKSRKTVMTPNCMDAP